MRSLVRFLTLAALLGPAVASAAPPKSGTWELAYSPAASAEQVLCLLKIDVKDGGAVTGEMVAGSPAMRELEVTGVTFEGETLRVQLKLNGMDYSFEGKVNQPDGKVLGSFGDDKRLWIARMAPTDKSEVARADASRRVTLPEPMTKAQQLNLKPTMLRRQALQAKEPEEKEKLLKQAQEAENEAKAEVPKLYKEVLEKYADSPAALDAAMNLVSQAGKTRADAEQVKRWAGMAGKLGAAYGPRFQRDTAVKVAEALSVQKPYAELAMDFAQRAEKMLNQQTPADLTVRALDALAMAQANADQTAAAAATEASVEKLQQPLDAEYKAKFPFKPTTFEGRHEKSDRVVVMELFTGAQCPPCVAADLAFDGLEKTYKPNDVVFLQYHMHIPGPDPMTNPITEGRWAYYRKVHGDTALRGVPSSVFNGKPQAGGGGGIPQAEGKYKAYRDIIDKLLEESPKANIALRASREGNANTKAFGPAIKMSASVSNLKDAGEDVRLRFVLAEEEIRFVGSNNIRFHHMVVRDMPGGADGFKLTDKGGEHSATVNLGELRTSLTKYLDEFVEKNGPFPKPRRPMALKNLKVIALVQDDKTGEILQAAQVGLGEEHAAK
jgi:hypothetical protein